MDGIIDQLNKTKKLFIIMLLTIMIIPPIAFMLSVHFRDSHFPLIIEMKVMMKSHWIPNQVLLLDFCPCYLNNCSWVVRYRNQTMVCALEMG
jgi:hypothetical protein